MESDNRKQHETCLLIWQNAQQTYILVVDMTLK